MPIYEYVPVDRECLMCDGKVAVIQGVNEEPLKFCPDCGLEVCRIISQASFKVSKMLSPEQAAEKGFATWRRSGKGVWEKVAGSETEAETPEQNRDNKVSNVYDLTKEE